ncbi:hypothetical protein IQ22_04056 [Pseudomonas duriflava]|uniref:Uncharacterized protein n=1 Tax=Pseudomonas duriflava TaxID=459528 RepID=A0A562PXX4_9PSED|nr:hypothetical protein [Pseudomonas duriflava]TWI49254.1 hypothetical protein IQ22_04056 [Pseudomonas duriflava]
MVDRVSYDVDDMRQQLSERLDQAVQAVQSRQSSGQDIPEAMHERLIRIRSMQATLEQGLDISPEMESFLAWEKQHGLVE